ncbi:MAG: hypothetical protein WAL97_05740 [Halobacteriota archaeon]
MADRRILTAAADDRITSERADIPSTQSVLLHGRGRVALPTPAYG